jgi:hypothetical protein
MLDADGGEVFMWCTDEVFALKSYNGVVAPTLRLWDKNEGFYIGLKSPDILAATRTYVLPATDGSSGQVLSTDGSGVLSWATAGAPAGITGAVQFNASGAFAADAATFFWDASNKRLGLGTNAPAGRLHLAAPTGNPLMLRLTAFTTQAGYLSFTNSGADYTHFIGAESSAGTGLLGSGDSFALAIGTGGSHPICFHTGGVTTPRLRISTADIRTSLDIIPNSAGARNVGTLATYFQTMRASNFQAINTNGGEFVVMNTGGTGYCRLTAGNTTLPSGQTNGSGLNDQGATTVLAMWTSSAAGSRGINIETGNGTAGNSGSILIKTGTATGTRGAITLNARILDLANAPLGTNWLPDQNATWNLGSGSAAFGQLYVTQIFPNTGNLLSITGDAGIDFYSGGDITYDTQLNGSHLFFGGPLRLPTFSSAPIPTGAGDMYYDTTTNKSYTWDGSTWQAHW